VIILSFLASVPEARLDSANPGLKYMRDSRIAQEVFCRDKP
jgi:hypothetical protein